MTRSCCLYSFFLLIAALTIDYSIGLRGVTFSHRNLLIKSSHLQRQSRQLHAKPVANVEVDEEAVEQALVIRVNKEVKELTGVGLDELINPSKVVNLERDLVNLRQEITQAKDNKLKQQLQDKIDKKEKVLFVEKRAVFQGWLKNLFVGQSILAGVASLGMVYDCIPNTPVPLSVQVLGFWMWWLFIIPSLRLVPCTGHRTIIL